MVRVHKKLPIYLELDTKIASQKNSIKFISFILWNFSSVFPEHF